MSCQNILTKVCIMEVSKIWKLPSLQNVIQEYYWRQNELEVGKDANFKPTVCDVASFLEEDIHEISGVARAACPGCHHFGMTAFVCFFLLRPKIHWLVGKDLFYFFLVITYFRTENQLVLQRRPFFLFWSSPIFWRIKGATTKSRPGGNHS